MFFSPLNPGNAYVNLLEAKKTKKVFQKQS